MSGVMDINIILGTLFLIKGDDIASSITSLSDDVSVAGTIVIACASFSQIISTIVLFSCTM